MLTLSQSLATFFHQPQPPWSTSRLFGDQKHELHLRSFVKTVSEQQVLAFIQIRPLSLLDGISSFDELLAKWNSAGNTKSTLDQVSSILRSAGAQIVYQSKDSKTIGIKGTNTSFGKIGAVTLSDKDFRDALTDISQAGAAATAGIAGLAAASATAGVPATIIIIGSFGVFAFAGLGLGLGLLALLASLPAQKAEPVPLQTDEELADSILGSLPDNLSQEVLDVLLKMEFDVDRDSPDPGQLPGAGDLGGGTGGTGEGDGRIGDIGLA